MIDAGLEIAALLALACALRALIGRRSWTDPRCPRCGDDVRLALVAASIDLSGSAVPTCACGAPLSGRSSVRWRSHRPTIPLLIFASALLVSSLALRGWSHSRSERGLLWGDLRSAEPLVVALEAHSSLPTPFVPQQAYSNWDPLCDSNWDSLWDELNRRDRNGSLSAALRFRAMNAQSSPSATLSRSDGRTAFIARSLHSASPELRGLAARALLAPAELCLAGRLRRPEQ